MSDAQDLSRVLCDPVSRLARFVDLTGAALLALPQPAWASLSRVSFWVAGTSDTATPRPEPRPLNDRPASRGLRGSGRRSASRSTVLHPRQEASS